MFLWIPGTALDSESERRLRSHALKPKQPMGEAWFLGETREIFSELLGDLDKISTPRIHQILEEIASGNSCFGPMDEWTDWYHYLLPRLLDRSNERDVSYTLELLNTCFFTLYPNERNIQGPYHSFKRDALATLGQTIMDGARWNGDHLKLGQALHRGGVAPTGYPIWRDVSGDLSSSLFFCTKYLKAEKFEPWLVSVLEIDSPHWRAQLMVWFSESQPFLTGEMKQISELKGGSTISWEASHYLNGHYTGDYDSVVSIPFLSEETIATKSDVVARQLKKVDFDAWLSSIAEVDYLHPVIDEFSDKFAELYL